MNLVEIIFTSVGLSLDIFAVLVCEGALFSKIEKNKLIQICGIFTVWQILAILVGNLITKIPIFCTSTWQVAYTWNILSVVIFVALGIYMLWKAWRDEIIFEQRMDQINLRKIGIIACLTSLDAFFAGIGFGFLDTDLLYEIIAIGMVTIIVSILGIYTGYRLGYEQKTKAYALGGILLILSGIDVVIRYML